MKILPPNIISFPNISKPYSKTTQLPLGNTNAYRLNKKQGLLYDTFTGSSFFKPAKNIQEATKFAKEKFAVEEFDVKTLQMANYINEAFFKARQQTNEQVILPKHVKEKILDYCYSGAVQGDTMFINPEVIPQEYMNSFWGFNISEELYKQYCKGDFSQRINILNNINENEGTIPRGQYNIVFHELGHINHRYTSPDLHAKYALAGTGLDIFKYGINSLPPIVKNHMDLCYEKLGLNIDDINSYAVFYPNEFVADMYAHLLSGYKLPPTIMEIYQLYGGPIVK